MKIINYAKMFIILLLPLCIFSMLIVSLKMKHFESKEEKIKEDIKNILNNTRYEENRYIFQDGNIGLLRIPKFDIEAPIYEGTSKDILKYHIGHFEDTSLWNGNVALASHNEGSYAHYFEKIKDLKNGEEIIYITNMGERRYVVFDNKVVKETNVEILKETKENIITLITCEKWKRDYRRCVIGIEKL